MSNLLGRGFDRDFQRGIYSAIGHGGVGEELITSAHSCLSHVVRHTRKSEPFAFVHQVTTDRCLTRHSIRRGVHRGEWAEAQDSADEFPTCVRRVGVETHDYRDQVLHPFGGGDIDNGMRVRH